jgi:hypothetical protein
VTRGRFLPSVCLLSLIAVLGPAPGRAAATPIRVGVAKTDLTWHVGTNRLGSVTSKVPDIAGQDVPDDPFVFAGLHTRPYAKAIVVDGRQRFAIVRADIVMVTGDLYEAVAQRVKAQTGIAPEQLLLAATHTHVANNGLFPHPAHGVLFRSFDPREQVFLADQIAVAVALAAAHTRPATLAAGAGSVTIAAENRRYTDREKNQQPPFANDPSRLDPELGVLRFDDAETGRPIAVVMNYGLHPVVLINNPLVSADFVGWAERDLEERLTDPETGAAPMGIWFTGAQGDQDALYVRYSYPEAEWTGRIFGDEAARVALGLQPEPLTGARLMQKLIPLPPPGGQRFPESTAFGPNLPLPGPASVLVPTSARLTAVELETASSSTVLMSWPGEPIRDIGVTLKERAQALGFDHAFVLALANDWAGYWLTPPEFDRGLYERTLMFYGRTSALYVEDQMTDLVHALATGGSPTTVALPPNALADRALTSAIARAGYTLDPALRAATVAVPETGFPIPLTIFPVGNIRPGPVRFEWFGGSPDVAKDWIPVVVVERRVGDAWVPVAHEGTGDVLLGAGSLPPDPPDWVAVWETLPDTPAGLYRFEVHGSQAAIGGSQPFTLSSIPFEVAACTCLRAGALQAVPQSDGSTLVRVAAHYGPVEPLPTPHVPGGFRLQPYVVTTGSATVEVLQGSTVIGTLTLTFVSDVEPVKRTVTVHDISGVDLPVTISEPTELGAFEGVWTGASGVTFRLASVTDGFGNS